MRDEGWFSILARILIVVVVILAVYVAFTSHRADNTQRGVIWGSVLLVMAIGLAFLPPLADWVWERHARQIAEQVAQEARRSPDFAEERQARQAQLDRCRQRIADLELRKKFARDRLDGLRKDLTSGNSQGAG
jgi:hypothetical protein